MLELRSIPTPVLLSLAAALTPGAASAAPQADPFTSGVRWTARPSALVDWTPEDARFAGDDAFVWTSRRGGPDSVALYDAVESGAPGPRGVVPRHPLEYGVAQIATGTRGDRVFALRLLDLPTTGPARRRPVLYAFDPTEAAAGAGMATAWAFDLGIDINSSAKLEADAEGRAVVAATWDDATGLAHVLRFDGTDGTLLAQSSFAAVGLDAIAVSDDGTRIAVTAGLELRVFDAALQGLEVAPLTSSTMALALSGDGRTVAHGRLGGLVVRTDFGFGYGVTHDQSAGGPEVPTRVDLSLDGTTAAVAWWNYSNGRAARLELFDLLFGFPLASQSLLPGTTNLQNLPVAARLSEDGRRAAFALWGNGTGAEVLVLEALGFGPALLVDLSGSARALDFDRTGTRVAIAAKSVHAQTFGARGEVRFVDTGERALQLTATPVIGGSIRASARMAGASNGFFLAGPLAASPLYLPGATHPLLLERRGVRVVPAAVDASGRMDLDLPVAMNPALVGQQIHLQAAFRVAGQLQLTSNLVSPFLLR